jgi:putative ABC transport system permease protein
MSLTRLLTFRSLRARPVRMILSTFGIVLGVAAILAIGITNQTAMLSVTNLFKETSGKANLIITSTEADSNGFSEKILPRLETFDVIVAAVPSVHVQTQLASEAPPSQLGLTFFGENTGGLTLYGIDPTRDRYARDYKLVEGNFLSGDTNADEVVLVRDFAKENELEVGNWMEIVASTGIEKLRVVGLIAKEGAGQLNNGTFGAIPLKTAQRLFYLDDKLDQIDLVITPEKTGSSELEKVRTDLQIHLGDKYSVVYPASQGRRMTEMLSSYQIGLNFLSGMALFIGAFLIFNAFQMTVVERTREFGMLRTVGMTRNQVTRQVLIEATALGVFGSIAGVILGIFMARGLTRLMEILLGQDLTSVQVPQGIVITGAMVGVVVAILAALVPSLQAGRISPLEALRVRAQSREGCVIRFGWIIGLVLLITSAVILVINPFPYDVQFRMGSMVVVFLFLGGTLMIPISVGIWESLMRPFMGLFFGRSGRLGSSNVRRAKLRTTLTVAALMIGVSMIIVVWAMTLSFKGDLDAWLKGYIGGDLYVTSSLQMGNDVWKRLESVEGVAAVAPSRYFEIEWAPEGDKREKVMFRAIDPASYSRITSFIFSQALPNAQGALEQLAKGDSVFISSVIAEKYGLKAGDTIHLVTKLGEQPFLISAIVVDYYNQGLVINGNWSDMWRYFRQRDANAFLVKAKDGYSVDQVADLIDKQYGKRDRLMVISNQQLLSQVSSLMSSAFRMFDVLAIISMLVGFLGITNTLTMNVMERTQEIGMLRGVGMTRGQLVRMILAEAALMGLIGGLLGVVFGVILSRIFMLAMTAMSGYNLTYILPVERVVVAIIIALIISQLAALFPAMRAARIRILDAIHYE